MPAKILSVVIPAYNEERTIGAVIQQVLQVPVESLGFEKEVIVVDDGSKDNTYRIASAFPEVKTITQPNQGKGRAVQAGIGLCGGDYVLVQNADLEYEIKDYIPMLQKMKQAPGSAIYGSRIPGQIEINGKFRLFPGKHPRQGFPPWLAGVMLAGGLTFCMVSGANRSGQCTGCSPTRGDGPWRWMFIRATRPIRVRRRTGPVS